MTTRKKIMAYLNTKPDWVSGMELELQAREWGTKPSTISRRLREMANTGEINHMVGLRKTVQYRHPSKAYKWVE